jgi:hypothetical protein
MAFLADLGVCEEKAALNTWATSPADPGSKQCVAAVKALAGTGASYL